MSLSYLARRLGFLVIMIWLAVTINFIVPRLTPGNPIQTQIAQMSASGAGGADTQSIVKAYEARLGLNQPEWRQYLKYWNSVLHFDFGYSLANFPERVSTVILAGLPWTVGLLGLSTLLSFLIGTVLGSLLAWPRSPRALKAFVPVIMTLSAIPYFLLGLVLLLLFAIIWAIFPAGGGYSYDGSPSFTLSSMLTLLRYGTLPALCIVLTSVGAWAIEMRGLMASTLREDYVNLARASGLKGRTIFIWYAVRNSLLPQFTSLGMTMGKIISGVVLVELIFSYPGVGYQLYQAIQSQDYFVIQGIVLILTFAVAVSMAILDFVYPLIDPRITYLRD